ncbi:MAG TPA: ABC transporter permease subunit [Candidatus Limnocylindrales bacterium]|nr:ABC transporter permease subunit [Candidatus Limnocylindrales bacterium]
MAARLHGVFAAAMVVYLLLPLAIAVPLSLTSSEFMTFPPRGLSLRWYEEFFTDAQWTGPTMFSLALAAVAATLATLLGSLAAWPLVRRRFVGRASLAALLGSPIVVPAISVAIGAFLVWAGLRLLGNPVSLVATHVVLTAPFVLLVVGAALLEFDADHIGAARTLGANGPTIARRIVAPQILPSLIAAWLFAFITSLDEVVITSFLLTAGQVPTLAVFIFSQVHWSSSPAIAASSVVLVGIALVIGLGIARLAPLSISGPGMGRPR